MASTVFVTYEGAPEFLIRKANLPVIQLHGAQVATVHVAVIPPIRFANEVADLFLVLTRSFGQLLKAGVPVKVVSERLGHATASITLDVYSHILPGMQAEAVARLDTALGAAAGE